MKNFESAQRAYDFVEQLKIEILRQVDYLNSIADGELQDGFSTAYLEDGWVALKGCSWGFVMHYDEPVRLDMTFGPDQPFVGHRITFVSEASGDAIAWSNVEGKGEVLRNVEQIARYGLRRLAGKVGDAWIFDSDLFSIPQAEIDVLIGEEMGAPVYLGVADPYQ